MCAASAEPVMVQSAATTNYDAKIMDLFLRINGYRSDNFDINMITSIPRIIKISSVQ